MILSEMKGTESNFDGALFLAELRQSLSDPDVHTPLYGRVKDAHQPYLDLYSSEAAAKADEDIEAAYTDTDPSYHGVFDRVREDYKDNFILVAKRLGLATLRLADRTDVSFSLAMDDAENRNIILDELGRDVRRAALCLSNKDLSTLSKSDFVASYLLYHSPAELKALRRHPVYDDLGFHWIKRAIRGYPKDPGGYMDRVLGKAGSLSQDPRFAGLEPGLLKFVAACYPRDPEKFLEKLTGDMETLRNNPRYANLGKAALSFAVLHYAKDPRAYLERVAQNMEELSRNPKYLAFGVWTIKYVAARWLQEPATLLDAAIAKCEDLEKDQRYETLPFVQIQKAVLSHPSDPEGFLDATIEKTEQLVHNPLFKDFGVSSIRLVAMSNKDAETFLKTAAERAKTLASNPEYLGLGRGVINVAVLRHPTNPEGFLRAVASKLAEMVEDPRYKGVPISTLKEAIRRNPRAPERHLNIT